MIDLDLDALAPQDKRIKLNGKEYVIKQPSLRQLMIVLDLSQELKDGKDEAKAFKKMVEVVEILVPEMKDEDSTFEQMFKLLEFIVGMATPEDLKKETTATSSEKKILKEALPE